jgi:hypothetical protein
VAGVRVPVVAAGLLLMERALVAAVGTPVAQAHALRSLGQGPVDPVAPLLAALALLAEALIGYVLAMLVLRSLCALPGLVGRLAGRAALVASPVMARPCSMCSSAGRCWPRVGLPSRLRVLFAARGVLGMTHRMAMEASGALRRLSELLLVPPRALKAEGGPPRDGRGWSGITRTDLPYSYQRKC